MKLVEGGNAPATKEDIRNLQATIVASVEVCALLIGQAIEHKALSLEKNRELREIMQNLIEKIQNELLKNAQNY